MGAGKRAVEGERDVVRGVKGITVLQMATMCHNQTHCFVQLTNANKTKQKTIGLCIL